MSWHTEGRRVVLLVERAAAAFVGVLGALAAHPHVAECVARLSRLSGW